MDGGREVVDLDLQRCGIRPRLRHLRLLGGQLGFRVADLRLQRRDVVALANRVLTGRYLVQNRLIAVEHRQRGITLSDDFGVVVAQRIGKIAGQDGAQERPVRGIAVDAEGQEHVVAQTRIGEKLVHRSHRHRHGLVVRGVGGNQVILAGEMLTIKPDRRVHLAFGHDRDGIRRELEGGGEFPVALVGELVGVAVRIRKVAFEHLEHEGLGVGHLLETVRLHGVGVEPVVVDEFLGRGDLADIVAEVLRLAADLRFLSNLIHRRGQVACNQVVAQVGRDHLRLRRPVALMWCKLGPQTCTNLSSASPHGGRTRPEFAGASATNKQSLSQGCVSLTITESEISLTVNLKRPGKDRA